MQRMAPSNVFFFSACSFVAGAIAGGLGLVPLYAFVIAILAFLLTLRSNIVFGVCIALLFVLGNAYYAFDDYRYRSLEKAVTPVLVFEGKVTDEPRRNQETQTAEVRIMRTDFENAVGARVYVRTELLPRLSYGDLVSVQGAVVLPPADSFGRYMAKERMHGTVFDPELEVIGNDGNFVLAALFGIRNSMQDILGLLFTEQHAAFLSGILLGDKDGFSPEFLEKLSLSGTMHLMALSGLNITIIVFVTFAVFSAVFRNKDRPKLIATFSVISLFVAMTGFQVSAIRAGLMAFLVGLANSTKRMYAPHIALAFAALLLTVWNPKGPVFDLGFQLSFLATIAIIYLSPVLKRIPLLKTEGVLGWRDALAITLAAQLGVLPITIINFENFSLTALGANIAILAVIPFLTVSGFVVVGTYMLYPPLAHLLHEPVAFLVEYVIRIVEVFAISYVPFNPEIGIVASVLYYGVLVWVCWRYKPMSSLKTLDANNS